LAIGAGPQNRIIALNPQQTPHLFVAGTSGAGKTRRLLRPLVAQALAAGYYAVLMNESGSDFAPFYDHANVTIVRGDVFDYVAVLEMAIQEVMAREEILRQERVSEWRRLASDRPHARAPILFAVDELLFLVALLPPAEQKKFWGLLAAFASRARKVGMSSVALATDPTYRVLGQGGLTYRSQCARLTFRMREPGGSRAMLDRQGAETLADGHFLALLDAPELVQGTAAKPDDEELRHYLDAQPLRAYPHPSGWKGSRPALRQRSCRRFLRRRSSPSRLPPVLIRWPNWPSRFAPSGSR
jgi:hypothetical protein